MQRIARIAEVLAEEWLAIANARGGGLRFGPEITALDEATRHDVLEGCRPLLAELAEAMGETTDLSILRAPGRSSSIRCRSRRAARRPPRARSAGEG